MLTRSSSLFGRIAALLKTVVHWESSYAPWYTLAWQSRLPLWRHTRRIAVQLTEQWVSSRTLTLSPELALPISFEQRVLNELAAWLMSGRKK